MRKRLSPIWLCYYIIVCYEAYGSRVSRSQQADEDFEQGKRVRRASKVEKMLRRKYK